jgi:ribose 5-phosphate isomerase
MQVTELLVELQPHARAAVEAAIVKLGGVVHRNEGNNQHVAVEAGGHTIMSVTVPPSVQAESLVKIDGIVGVYANPKIEPFGMLP